MSTSNRPGMILDYLKKNPVCRISDLSELCGVSQVTTRKDLDVMEAEGLITRQHGKVILSERSTYSYVLRSKLHILKKQAIAKVAVDMLAGFSSVALDAGTTTSLIAEEILSRKSLPHLDVVTNSLPVALMVSSSQHDVSLAGGIVLRQSASSAGPDAEEYIRRLRTEIAFIGCTGVRAGEGLCTGVRLEGCVKDAMIKTAGKVVAVFDDSKWFNTAIHLFCDFSSVDTIITTRCSHARPEESDSMEKLGIEIIYADDIYPIT